MNDGIEITPDEFLKLPKGSYILIDMRSEESFMQGHIEGAVYTHENIRSAGDIKLIFYCQYGIESLETAVYFRKCGFKAYSLKGGYVQWLKKQTDMFDMEELERYDRQITLAQIGMTGQEKLKSAGVLIIGAGGLGCPCGMYLAAAGVGRIGIIDHDEVSLSNMNRQVAHRETGLNKAVSLKTTLVGINDKIQVTAYPERFGADNAAELLDRYDFVIDCTDTAETKFMVNDLCVGYDKPYCYGGVIGFEGQVMTVIPHKTACLRCIFEEPPTGCETCESHGIIGAAAGIMGCIQALEAIKYITSQDDLLTDKMFIFDMLTMKARTVGFGGIGSKCSICRNKQ
ncbi:ThiF family adenylyltransferase [uncultured Ruminococcus sp.]|uniref:ThiF family adenylyltransferase n=1 Tax=uncultured Ruminococcus sp. TaxID=165186 RepID=UPI0025F47E74|nr:ThiF family adenylyltransferase [uncultured Ruminococcus sp.]